MFFQVLSDIGDQIDGGLSSFFDNWVGAIIQLLATILLAIIIRVFFWKPISNFIKKKQDAVTSDLNEAKEANKLALEAKEQAEVDYKNAREEIAQLKAKLTKEAYNEKDRIILEAKDEAKRRLDQLEIDLQNEIYESQEDIKKAIKEIAFLAAEKIVEHEIDDKVHSKTVDKVIEEKLIQ